MTPDNVWLTMLLNKRSTRARGSASGTAPFPELVRSRFSGGLGVKRTLLATAGAAVLLNASGGAVWALETRVGEVDVDLRAQADFQGAYFSDEIDSGAAGNVDWSVRLRLEHLLRSGWLVGASVEVDHDVDIESDGTITSNNVELDEAYAYLSNHWGRIEAGIQDGPAQTMSYKAPTTGIGQVGGDFSRYAGTDAQMSPYDSRDALKVVYYSPPFAGLRVGASFAPSLESNEDDPIPTARTIQSNLIELAAQYQAVQGPIVLGFSGAFASGSADAVTQRADIRSWSVGTEVRYDDLRIGGAYVSRGDSNALVPLDESEFNAGIAWGRGRFDIAASGALIESNTVSRRLVGLGTSIDLTDFMVLRLDGVMFSESYDDPLLGDNDGFVALTDLRIHF